MSNLLSYTSMVEDRNAFRRAGTRSGNEFNYADVPSNKYFKIFFYFDNGDVNAMGGVPASGSVGSGGLLAPTWTLEVDDKSYYMHNSAWAYLKMNFEEERAELLKNFVTLLSNISSNSPWYFTELSGLDAALERKQTTSANFAIEEERKKISIKCLQDAYDDRIGTLLDLYRSIVWSWVNKREIIPANLRKFDMGVMIFNDSIKDWGLPGKDEFDASGKKITPPKYTPSYKYVEFHNCEIDYNSSKGPYGTLDSKTGLQPEYTIDISFDDCYETRFNEFLIKELGDMVRWDWDSNPDNYNNDYIDVQDKNSQYNQLYQNLHQFDNVKPIKNAPGSKKKKMSGLSAAVDQLVATGKNYLSGVVKRAVLGNLYTFSLTKMGSQLKGVASGQVWSTARAINEYVKDAKHRNEGGTQYVDHIGDIFPEPETGQKTEKTLGDIHSEPTNNTKYVSHIGNIYKSETLRNNI